eukprot:CAMPEP_0114992232 /NCGR_PEP_ID=MMETSP0216-20121206/11823_1 /TAXON_ID=223996 /ORGANISM="Protocruzia adherens, Strain Boccale" /LENGTH=202 /DNA_ID=CAMNT_0002355667 /DNA_START=114 /DNA_END=722 /DNA_ORIENTATION=-
MSYFGGKRVRAGALKAIKSNLVHIDGRTDDERKTKEIIKYASVGNTSRFISLMQEMENVDTPLKDGETALHFACLNGRFSIAEYLLKRGANMNAIGAQGSTPLLNAVSHLACGNMRNERIVPLLLTHGADPLYTSPSGLNAYSIAANLTSKTLLDELKKVINPKLTWKERKGPLWLLHNHDKFKTPLYKLSRGLAREIVEFV